MRNDNVRHALIALCANSGKYALTATDVRRIVFGVTGREFVASTWTTGMRRAQVGVNLPRTMGRVIRGHTYPWRWSVVDVGSKIHGILALTQWGQLEARERCFVDSVNLDVYDANAWVPRLRPIADSARWCWALGGMAEDQYVTSRGDFRRIEEEDEYGGHYDIGGWREIGA